MGKAKDEIGHSGLFTEKLGNKEGVKPDLQPVKLPRQVKILVRQAAGIMGRQRQLHFVPANVNVRMVRGRFSQRNNLINPGHRRRKILELKSPRNEHA